MTIFMPLTNRKNYSHYKPDNPAKYTKTVAKRDNNWVNITIWTFITDLMTFDENSLKFSHS